MKDRRLRMIWNSNGIHVPSGYGVHQKHLLYRLLADGWPTAQISFTGLEGAPITLDGLTIYPRMVDTWGSDALIFHSRHFQAQVVFTMQDIWTLQPQYLGQLNQEKRVFIPYVPVDKEPVPPGVLERLRYAYKIITFSEFGQKALLKNGFSSTLIKESTDVNELKPLDKVECRKFFNLPQNKFIFGMIGANKPDMLPRKGWQEALEAFAIFHKNHPESIFFCTSNQPGGFPLIQFGKQLGISSSIYFPDEYMAVFHGNREFVCKMLNSFDVLLHPSTTEGFGLVVIEAQACGIPVIINNNTSMPELIIEGKTGEICLTGKQIFSPDGGYILLADVNSLVDKMELLYQKNLIEMGKSAREFIVKNYNIDKKVQEEWIPFLIKLQDELLGPLDTKSVKT